MRLALAILALLPLSCPHGPSEPPATTAPPSGAPPITLPAAQPTPDPGPSIPPPAPGAPDGEPSEGSGACPCAWKFGLTLEPVCVGPDGGLSDGFVEGGHCSADTTQKFTSRDVACDADHDNCGGRDCNDPRGPLFRVQAPSAALSCDDAGGKPCPRADPWEVQLGSEANPLVSGTYTVTSSLRLDLRDALGVPVSVCPGGPISTTRSWSAP